MTDSRSGVERIARERRRQIEEEGFTAEHDDRHTAGDLAVFAAALAVYGTDARIEDPLERVGYRIDGRETDDWGLCAGHRQDRLRQLEIAGALIAAEIDRVERRVAAHG